MTATRLAPAWVASLSFLLLLLPAVQAEGNPIIRLNFIQCINPSHDIYITNVIQCTASVTLSALPATGYHVTYNLAGAQGTADAVPTQLTSFLSWSTPGSYDTGWAYACCSLAARGVVCVTVVTTARHVNPIYLTFELGSGVFRNSYSPTSLTQSAQSVFVDATQATGTCSASAYDYDGEFIQTPDVDLTPTPATTQDAFSTPTPESASSTCKTH
ncbi:hypothetical protein F751_3249 [Auxenochlorella protothecoides]|uniref:Uncharacterized protein n=1 Tax=Auxenochlorella protothecoides TaxID=3075 RepID=A0A087STW4_AUXPR|nr:hypothetical protein F751_3249 [Auxenochlorella protothecoides]KFM29168.1 hypothetical protein F751_3249 [Auxenochlorella protothecoides]